MGSDGIINLAPFSFFNQLSADPPCVMYCPNSFKPGTEEHKDSLLNAEDTGEFVYNMCTADLLDQMVLTSKHSPRSLDEMADVGLETAPCELVKPPRVMASPVALECKYLQTVHLPRPSDRQFGSMVIGEIVGIHIADGAITDDGLVDTSNLRPVTRLGYLDYAIIEPDQIFSMSSPDDTRFVTDDG